MKEATPTKSIIKLLQSLTLLRKESYGTGANCEPQFPLSPYDRMPPPRGKYKQAVIDKVVGMG